MARDTSRSPSRLAGDLGALQAIRGGLRAKLNASPLLDGKGFARAFEQALRTIASHRLPVPRDPPA